jgi:hypothetical protein
LALFETIGGAWVEFGDLHNEGDLAWPDIAFEADGFGLMREQVFSAESPNAPNYFGAIEADVKDFDNTLDGAEPAEGARVQHFHGDFQRLPHSPAPRLLASQFYED